MLPYSRGLILDNTHNYGIMKTETVFGFGPQQNNYLNDSFNTTQPLEWIFANGSFQKRSLDEATPRKIPTVKIQVTSSKKSKKNKKKSLKRKSKKVRLWNSLPPSVRQSKVNKCIIKFLKKGQGQQQQQDSGSHESYSGKKRRRRRRGGNKLQKMQKKYMMPVILGLLAAKSILIPIALKALAFISAKGLMMGFFSTVMASVISLKGMFNHPHEYHNRKDDAKTQVEIIQVPTKSEDHVYYDEHYRRGDYVPGLGPNDVILTKKSNFDWKDNRNQLRHQIGSKNFSGEKGNRIPSKMSR